MKSITPDPMLSLPFEVGALYNRRTDIHELLGGQWQGGISTPADQPFVIAFTGEAGKSHGYADFWFDEQEFHYYGEGQEGDMTFTGGNHAIGNHQQDGKRLLVFQMMGRGKPYRYLGEFVCVGSYTKPDTPATRGPNRTAIVFRLQPLGDSGFFSAQHLATPDNPTLELEHTVSQQLVEVRNKQTLFRRRLLTVEKQCRLTGVQDLRFLRASHIKPWAMCATGEERVDGHNGFLLTPHADLLFDRGWLTFESSGGLVVSESLPSDVRQRLGLNLRAGRRCGPFSSAQQSYLEFHQNKIFDQRFKRQANPLESLVSALGESSSQKAL